MVRPPEAIEPSDSAKLGWTDFVMQHYPDRVRRAGTRPARSPARPAADRRGARQIRTMALHYGIYADVLPGVAPFRPRSNLIVRYDDDGGEDRLTRVVYRGNELTPTRTARAPSVTLTSMPGQIWTLAMLSPDDNPQDWRAPLLHWLM